ncbi:hypothetical protein CU669_20795 [Paramagnetospirillum kuznetsovii]|uniref:Uncharacterized protein n=1 Tax=Paramagnetospirillum kuznetsovii TaxID=2053833 RepID=A0A364NSC7_9PROT|nr:tetratricopeptide repeat protein [Paramagnetospirillum kuznetsovii]RAU19986.1 hypothetical protein CU669_20795 [Paramagnetospirillum kuznetsovii]
MPLNRKQRRTQAKKATGSAPQSAGPSVQQLVAEALQHHHAGRLTDAIAAYRRVLALVPGSAPAYCNLGVAIEAQGRLDEAIAAYR